MSDVLYLAWRYVTYHRVKTVVLICSITLVVYLPVGLHLLVDQSAKELTSRAEATPLLAGARGSSLELVLSSLYYESDTPPTMQHAELTRIAESKLASAIPLYTRFRTEHSMIVGTSHDYFSLRGLEIDEGRSFNMLGECVLGSQAARIAQAAPGHTLMSQPENVFDLAGAYPLKMHVVGVLKPTGTPDDRAVFVDVKTAWIIEGVGHGHNEVIEPPDESQLLSEENGPRVTHASTMKFNEITRKNVASFHFHGDQESFPLTAVIAVPHDEKSSTLLEGRYLTDDEPVQIVRPNAVMQDLLRTVMTVQRYVIVAAVVIGFATLAIVAMVFVLSFQLRRREIETMIKIGGTRIRIASLITVEIVGVLATGIVAACALSLATGWFASSMTRLLIQLS